MMTLRPSPNFDDRPAGDPIDMLVVHYTGMQTAEAALNRLCDPSAKVSAHYLIDTDGSIFAMVDEDKRAWHAGVSYWRGQRDINARSIGIELVNPGHEFGYIPFAEDQIGAFESLAKDILNRHPIPARNIVGHSDVAPARKTDPGELFPWQRMSKAGIGLWPLVTDHEEPDLGKARRLLSEIGYDVPLNETLDAAIDDVLCAFQRRYRPAKPDGGLDPETAGLIAAVHALSHR